VSYGEHRASWNRVAVVLLLLLAGSEFATRGVMRGIGSGDTFNDFLSPYIQAKAWVRRLDPYSPQSVVKLWPDTAVRPASLSLEADAGTLILDRGIPTAYTPSCLLLIAPFAALPWSTAACLWMSMNVFLTFVWMILLIPAGWQWQETRSLAFLACALALAPFQTGLATLNPVIPACALGGIAVCLAERRSFAVTGSLVALSATLKPQIGLCFLAFFIMRRMWKASLLSFALAGAVTGLAILRMQAGHVAWLANYRTASHTLISGGVLSDFTSLNPTQWGLINSQLLTYEFFGERTLANDAAWLAFGMLAFLWMFRVIQRRSDRIDNTLLDLSAMAVLSLLPIYHRFYDAVVLIIPLAWLFGNWGKLERGVKAVVCFALLPFLLPGGTMLQVLLSEKRVPASVASAWWWRLVVLPHEVWALIALSLVLLYAMTPRGAALGLIGRRNRVSVVEPQLTRV